MRWLVGLSTRLVSLVVVAATVLLVAGMFALSHASVDVLPELSPVKVQVQTEALGLSASEVEQFITVPLEDEFNGLANNEHIRSKSLPNLSAIEVTFKPGTDLYHARQLLTERVAQGPAMVNVGSPPVMIQPQSSENRVAMIGLSSRSLAQIDLSTMAYWQIRPRLLAVPGVASVSIWGQRDKELQVLVDPVRMNARGVTLEQILATTGDAMWTSPLTFVEASSPGSDGFIDMPNQRISVQHILPISSADDLRQIPLEDTGGRLIRLGEVADVVKDHPPLRGDAVLSSGPGFLMVVEKLPGADTASVQRGVDSALAAMKPGLGDVRIDTGVFRPADFIATALSSMGLLAVASLLLVAAWLGLALRSWRVMVIALVSLTLSFVGAAWVLYARGVTFNLLTAAGLAMGIGVIVGGVVMSVTAARERLAAWTLNGDPTPASEVVIDSLAEAGRTFLFGALIVAIVAAPMLLFGGLTGKLVTPVVSAYLLAVAAAVLVAVLLTPAFAVALLPGEGPRREGGLGSRMASRFSAGAAWLARKRAIAWTLAVLLAAAAIGAAAGVKAGAFVPQTRDNDLVVQWQAAPGTSLTELDRVASRAGEQLRAIPGVAEVSSHVGQALMGDQIVDVDSGETWIALSPSADRVSTLAKIDALLREYVGLKHTLHTYPESVLAAEAPASTHTLVARVYGSDFDVLKQQADKIREAFTGIDGIGNPYVVQSVTQPGISIEASLGAGAPYGLSPGAIRRQTSVLVAGIAVGSYYEQQRIFDVAVWSEPAQHSTIAEIGNVELATPGGGRVPLSRVANVTMKPVPHEIDHDRAERYAEIDAAVSDTQLGVAQAAATRALGRLNFPLGYHAEVVSDSDQQSVSPLLILSMIGSVIFVYLLLHAALASWSRALLVLLSLPLSAAGAFIVMWAAGLPNDAGAFAGLSATFAVAVISALLVVREIEREEAAENRAEVPSIAAAAGPVLVLAVAVGLGVLPFAVSSQTAGLEILSPMAVVVLGGLVSTVFTTLLVLPGVTLRVEPAPIGPPTRPASEEGAA